jgi:plastocyanin
MMRRSFLAPFGAVVLVVASCGGGMNDSGSLGAAPSTPATPNLITISGTTFMPARLLVTPGAMVTVKNLDAAPHSVTSEATANAFRPGSVAGISFDTGPVMSEATFMIPAAAAVGTVIPYFSSIDAPMMAMSSGEIEVVAETSMPMPMPMSMSSMMP